MRELTDKDVGLHVDEIADKGYSIIEDVIDVAFRQDIIDELDRLESVRPGGDIVPKPSTGIVTRRWFDVLNDGEVWQRVATHPWIMAVLPRVLGKGFLLSTMGSAVIGPGERAQSLHVDDAVYSFPRPHPNLVCNTMWAVGDFTAENGATLVVPGSNQFETDPVIGEEYESIPVEMPAGSIAFVLGSSYHAGGENKTDRDRIGLTINYCDGRMRQQENLMLGIHPARLLTFPPALQDILGFKMGGPAAYGGCGHVFASDPRVELQRHYGDQDPNDPYMEKRCGFQRQRWADQRSL